MSRRTATTLVSAILVVIALHAAPATAQSPLGGAVHRMVRFGFGGGVTVPVSDAADAFRNGINGQAFALVQTGLLPPMRFNLGYQRFDFDTETLPDASAGTASMLSAMAGLSIPLMRLGPVQPYITAGLGAINVSNSFDATGTPSESQLHFGIDGGAGFTLRLGPLEGFVEGRLQNVYNSDSGVRKLNSIRTVPVTFGLLL